MRTREEKIKRLQELLKGCERGIRGVDNYQLAISWLSLAEPYTSGSEFVNRYCMLRDEAQATWDVHTGVAFTKLYRFLYG